MNQPYEPTEEEIYGKLTKEIQKNWTLDDWQKRARIGPREYKVREFHVEPQADERPPTE